MKNKVKEQYFDGKSTLDIENMLFEVIKQLNSINHKRYFKKVNDDLIDIKKDLRELQNDQQRLGIGSKKLLIDSLFSDLASATLSSSTESRAQNPTSF